MVNITNPEAIKKSKAKYDLVVVEAHALDGETESDKNFVWLALQRRGSGTRGGFGRNRRWAILSYPVAKQIFPKLKLSAGEPEAFILSDLREHAQKAA